MKKYTVITFLILSLLLTGCATSSSVSDKSNKFTIFTSLYPIQYAVERIAGETVVIESVYPPGVDAHTYEPAAKEITAIAEGDAFIYLGAGMEAFAETTAQALKAQELKLIELGRHHELFHMDSEQEQNEKDEHHTSHEEHDSDPTESTEIEQQNHNGHEHGGVNPHIWLDPLRMIKMSAIIKNELINLRPEYEHLYRENFQELKKDLLALDQEFKETLLPKDDKRILVSHAAYSYWEDRYGIEQLSIRGISSTAEPSQKDITKILETAEHYNMQYVIFEQNSADRLADLIKQEIDAEALYLHNLSVLTDEDIKNGENYFSFDAPQSTNIEQSYR